MPVELTAVAVFRRAMVVNVPLTILNVPTVPLVIPTWLSCGSPLMDVLLSFGALDAVPKLKVPARISKFHGTVICADAALSMSVQFAVLLCMKIELVPPGSTLARRLVKVPRPDNVTNVLVGAVAVLVKPPPTSNPLTPPSSVKFALKSSPRLIVCGLADKFTMVPVGTIGLPFRMNDPAPGLKI